MKVIKFKIKRVMCEGNTDRAREGEKKRERDGVRNVFIAFLGSLYFSLNDVPAILEMPFSPHI